MRQLFALSVSASPGIAFSLAHIPGAAQIRVMGGIKYLTDEKGRKVGVLIDLKKHGAIWQDFWDGLVYESRRKERSILYEHYRAALLKRTRSCV